VTAGVQFLTELVITPVGPKRWKVAAPLVCATPLGPITVPAKFETDGASVPRALWRVFPPFDGDYDAAAVLHDYAYRNSLALGMSREQADNLLRDGMVATNTAAWKRRAIYWGVRLGGAHAWNTNREKEAQST
jgi:hypothetical protein